MKTFMVGCLIIAVIGTILFAVGGYFLYRAASPMLEDARAYLSRMGEPDEISQQLKNTASHTPPDNGQLTDVQVQRFVRVQDSVRAALGQRFDAIDAKYRHLKGNGDATAAPSLGEVIGGLGEIAAVFVDARRYRVAALNEQHFSQDEYSWVRDRVFQAAGMEITSVVDLRKIEDAVRNGTGINDIGAPRLPTADVPAKNRALVKPHMEKMDQWLPLAFFGL